MICAYDAEFTRFVSDCRNAIIAELVATGFQRCFGFLPGESERQSWRQSLPLVAKSLSGAGIQYGHVFVELQMPLSSARCDLLILGLGDGGQPAAIVIELKQWSRVSPSAIRDTVSLFGRPVNHPSVQVRSYVNYLKHFHSAFSEGGIPIHGCAYLHNVSDTESKRVLVSQAAFDTTPREYPLFFDNDDGLGKFVASRINKGETLNGRQIVLEGVIKPSTKLLDLVAAAVQGNFEWQLLDEQLLAFNQVVELVERAKVRPEAKQHLILVRGGPGTGKSVLAIQLLAYGARNGWRIAHATGSLAFKVVLQAKIQHFADEFLKRIHSARYKSELPVKEVFATFRDVANVGATGRAVLDLVVGDEGHRLWDYRRNARTYEVESQTPMIEEMLSASKVTVIFLDDNQGVRANEIGSIQYLQEQANRLGIDCALVDLNVQFRCAGSTSYLQWIDNRLGFEAPPSMAWRDAAAYDFRIVDDMLQMRETLLNLSGTGDRTRIVAGFCWKWSEPRADGSLVADVSHPRFNGWAAPWIEKGDRYAKPMESRYFKWANDNSCFDQVGSIYSVQGFEFDYVGVIFGDDLVVRDGRWCANLARNKDRQFQDDLRRRRTLGHSVDEAGQLRNIYRVLLTRGMKGTFVHFLDDETREHFRRMALG